jgi:hypothetical protein
MVSEIELKIAGAVGRRRPLSSRVLLLNKEYLKTPYPQFLAVMLVGTNSCAVVISFTYFDPRPSPKLEWLPNSEKQVSPCSKILTHAEYIVLSSDRTKEILLCFFLESEGLTSHSKKMNTVMHIAPRVVIV